MSRPTFKRFLPHRLLLMLALFSSWLSSFYRPLMRFVDKREFFDAPAQFQEINLAICRIDGRI